ncbi:hypothetical protein JX265_002802 [Neoarthrinium moseri]|uniref:Uncharacterized protein n=1 Tax=Neoarthrinium moseri TaxID=1658444 RepID=A0A9P9WT35_9PEZI|nr:hypothetical protein JX265_002802 [Neoarthrinium moseri]
MATKPHCSLSSQHPLILLEKENRTILDPTASRFVPVKSSEPRFNRQARASRDIARIRVDPVASKPAAGLATSHRRQNRSGEAGKKKQGTTGTSSRKTHRRPRNHLTLDQRLVKVERILDRWTSRPTTAAQLAKYQRHILRSVFKQLIEVSGAMDELSVRLNEEQEVLVMRVQQAMWRAREKLQRLRGEGMDLGFH